MNRIKHMSDEIATYENFTEGFEGYARNKHSRPTVIEFESNLQENLNRLIEQYKSGNFSTPVYRCKEILYPKRRIVCSTDVENHILQWSALLPIEKKLTDSFIERCSSCVIGRGTHYHLRKEVEEMRRCTQEEVYYTVQLDIHHYFQWIEHNKMKERVRSKIKDRVLLTFLDEFIDSYDPGLVLGVKLSQILSSLYLSKFDRDAIHLFGISNDPEKYHYWQSRYVNDRIATARSPSDIEELGKGIIHLNSTFDKYLSEGLRHYSRFADNITIKHRDKAFLRIATELCVMVLARDYHLSVNKSWNIRPSWMGNDICGYVIYHDHVRLRKRNKKALCRQVAKLRKRGLSRREIQLRCASRLGFAKHANTINLIRTLDMQRLGEKIKEKRHRIPFSGMSYKQKQSIDNLICRNIAEEDKYWINLIDYTVMKSVIDTDENNEPADVLAIRYVKCSEVSTNRDGEKTYTWEDEEHYCYTGSKIMIDQIKKDISREDLPCCTVIREFSNGIKKKFYKFT